MNWYYAEGEQRFGPFEEVDFQSMVRTGVVGPQTLVWHEGMPNWIPLAQSGFGGAGPTVTSDGTVMQTCIVTGQMAPESEMMLTEHGWVSAAGKAIYAQRLKEGITPTTGSVEAWRDKKFVVVNRHNPQLPLRCVRSNAPINQSNCTRKKVTYTPPAVYLGILINLIVVIILAAIFSKRFKIDVGLSPEEAGKRKNRMWIYAGMLFGGLALSVVGPVYENYWLLIPGILTLLFGAGLLGHESSIITIKKLTDDHIWLRGCKPEFVNSLPEF